MFNNPYLLEQMINEKLTDLRTEGMRSQMLAQAGLQTTKSPLFPVIQRFLHQMIASMTHRSPRRVEQPLDLQP